MILISETSIFYSFLLSLSGYEGLIDLRDFMKEHQTLLEESAKLHTNLAKKCKSKIKGQPAISSYNTTRRAQLQTIRTSEKIVPHIETRCTAIKQVITDFQRQVDRIYTNRSLGRSPRHNRTEELKNSFKSARSTVKRLAEELEASRGEAKRAADEFQQAAVDVEKAQYSKSSSKSKLAKAEGHLTSARIALTVSNDTVARTEEQLEREQDIYRERAMEIFEKCQTYEQERLDLIRETLIKFVQAMHSSEYSEMIDDIFENLLDDIKNKQSTSDDLRFWAEAYGADDGSEATDEEEEEEAANEEDAAPQPTFEAPVEAVIAPQPTPEAPVVEETATAAENSNKSVNKKKKKQNNATTTETSTPDTLPEEQVWKADLRVENANFR